MSVVFRSSLKMMQKYFVIVTLYFLGRHFIAPFTSSPQIHSLSCAFQRYIQVGHGDSSDFTLILHQRANNINHTNNILLSLTSDHCRHCNCTKSLQLSNIFNMYNHKTTRFYFHLTLKFQNKRCAIVHIPGIGKQQLAY